MEPCDESFFKTAPQRHHYSLKLAAPASAVWSGLTADTPLKWCRLLRGAYTSDRPFGVGTQRTVTVGKVLRLDEEFTSWDEGRGHSFSVTSANFPLFRRFGEDYRITPTTTGCVLDWTFAYEPIKQVRPAIAMRLPNEALFRSLVHDTRRHFKAA